MAEGSFEWDENKRRANLGKHGIDFIDSMRVFSDPTPLAFPPEAITGSHGSWRSARLVQGW
jgi:uncharacterized DUF497 family protein